MLIEPRQVEPGAVWRWTRQALSLIARGWIWWFGLALLGCLGIFLGNRFPIFEGMLALATFFASILVAARLDRAQRASFGEILAMLMTQLPRILTFAGLIAVAGAIIWMLLLSRPDVAWWHAIYSERNALPMLSEDWMLAARQVFVYSAYALGLSYFGLNIPGLTAFFQFPASSLLGIGWRDAYRLSAQGQVKNLPAMLGIGLLFVVLPAVSALALPELVPLLYCFFGALSYVAFRDIFLGIPDNASALVARTATARS